VPQLRGADDVQARRGSFVEPSDPRELAAFGVEPPRGSAKRAEDDDVDHGDDDGPTSTSSGSDLGFKVFFYAWLVIVALLWAACEDSCDGDDGPSVGGGIYSK
jgi:hypothetical protein